PSALPCSSSFPTRRSSDLDDFIQIVERLLETDQQVLPVAGFAQLIVRAPANHVDAMLDEIADRIHQPQLARLPVDDRQHDDAEADRKSTRLNSSHGSISYA